MKTRIFNILAVVPLLFAGLSSAQAPDYTKTSETGIQRIRNQGDYKEAKIAIVWGDHLKPPSDSPRSIINLRDAMLTWTHIPVSIMSQVRLSSPDIRKLPILFISSNEPSDLSEIEKRNLREYIKNGGFVVADGDLSLLQMVRDIAGGKRVERIPSGHPIYQTPFLTGGPVMNGEAPRQTDPRGRMVLSEEAEGLLGVFIDGRLAVIYSPKGYYRGWQANNDAYLKFGVNLIMYAITGG